MSFNYAREYKKWIQWKSEEEILLRKLKVDEMTIQKLRDFDYQTFLAERRIKRKQMITKDVFFLNIPSYDVKEIGSIEDILDNIENEALLGYLLQTDPKTLKILLLKVLGYSTLEISNLLQIDEGAIYGRIHRLKKKLKKFAE